MAFGKFFTKKEAVPAKKPVPPVAQKTAAPKVKKTVVATAQRPVAAQGQRPVAPVDSAASPITKLEAQFLKNLNYFKQYNKHKNSVMEGCMSEEKLAAYKVLSLLLHLNLSGLPGYLENPKVPVGIKHYQISKVGLETAKKLFRNAYFSESALIPMQEKHCAVESLLTIGSIGSVAQNSHSDFDFWLCVDESKFNSEEMFLLKKKIKKIEEWADEKFDLEVHFFITDFNKAIRNEFGSTDEESTGTAMAKLLKEEFLRSYFQVAGKTPYWSMAPVDAKEENYNKLLEFVKKSKHLNEDDFIDLGPTPSISMDEYFGAALWQINKALSSPYKSVFKMALLLAYVLDEKGGFICDIVKKKILEKKPESGWPDPYLIMFERILNFFHKRGEEKSVDLLRKCMYLKMDIKILRSDYQSTKNVPKKTKIINYIREWKWNHETIQELNNFDTWSFKKSTGFGMLINNFLISAYRELSDLVKTRGSEIKISQNDLTVLGRKIYAIYSKQPAKIYSISQFSDKDPHQAHLTLSRTSQHGQNEVFNVYMDDVTNRILKKQDTKDYFLYNSKSALGALSWIVLNKCYGPKTRLNIMNYQFAEEMTSLIEDLFAFFPPMDISKIDSQKLLNQAVKEKVYIVINFSIPRWTKEIKTVGVISRNSWGEMFLNEYSGPEGLNKAVDILRQGKFELLSEVKNFYKIYIPKGDCYSPLMNLINNTLKRNVTFHFGNQSFYKHSGR